MSKYYTELSVGIFMFLGLTTLAYLSVTLGKVDFFSPSGYVLYAQFDSTSGLKKGAAIEIAGVTVGKVEDINLENYSSLVTMRIFPKVEIQDDAIVSVRTTGLIGEKFIKINPGGSDEILMTGDTIIDTESSISIEELISKYIFSQDEK